MLFNIQIVQILYICIEYNKKTLTQMCEVDIVPVLHIWIGNFDNLMMKWLIYIFICMNLRST